MHMNLLWLTPEIPYPLNTGGKVGIFKRIELLSANNEITLVSIINSADEEKYRGNLLRYCKNVMLVNRNRHKSRNFVYSLWRMPYACASRMQTEITNYIRKAIQLKRFDAIIVDSPQMILNLPFDEIKNIPVVLGQHNIEYKTMRSIGKSLTGLKKLIFLFDAGRMEKLEDRIYQTKKIDLFTFVSKDDEAFFQSRYPDKNTLLVPVGVDMEHFTREIQPDRSLMYIGNMTYPPNEEAVTLFVNEIWPRILSEVPDAHFYIVGKEPSASVRKLMCKNITVTGTVLSVKKYYDCCNLVVLPLKSGGGVKVKLLEALSYGKYVVTTKKGIEGTDLQDGEHLFVRGDSQSFADVCIQILLNPKKYLYIKDAAFKILEQKYTWKGVCRRLEDAIRNLNQEQPKSQLSKSSNG